MGDYIFAYEEGDIILFNLNAYNYMIISRRRESFIPRYELLCLNNGRYSTYYAMDIDSNSRRVGK